VLVGIRQESGTPTVASAPNLRQTGEGRDGDLEEDFGVTVRGIVKPEYRQGSHDFHAGRVHCHQDHALLLIGRGGRVALPHEDADLAPRVGGAGCPPLVPRQYIAVALPASQLSPYYLCKVYDFR